MSVPSLKGRKEVHMFEVLMGLSWLYAGRQSFMTYISSEYVPGTKEYVFIDEVYTFAEHEFRHQSRETGEKYIRHLEATTIVVFHLLQRLKVQDPVALAAALLHDLFENIRTWKKDTLAARFSAYGAWGVTLAEYVYDVSKRHESEFDGSKARRDAAYHLALLRVSLAPALIKIGDTIHNLVTSWGKSTDRQNAKIYFANTVCRELVSKHDIVVPELGIAVWMAQGQLYARRTAEVLLPSRSV
jgi:(p)ppGpp synthase/HD superfamily hydrolase